MSGGSTVYAMFLDASKAFDSVKHSKLFDCLNEINICPVIVRIIIVMYSVASACISWGGVVSSYFNLLNGVRQGGILSPMLFSMLLNDLLENIHDSKMGCHIGNSPVNAFVYADDIVLLSPTIIGLRGLLNLCEDFSNNSGINFNPKKSSLLIFSRIVNSKFVKIYLNDILVPILNVFNHLGSKISNVGLLHDFDTRINDMKARCNVILREYSGIDVKSRVEIFNRQCIALYGCPLWDLQSANFKKICIAWRVCCRRILNLPRRTHSKYLPYLMNSSDLLTIAENRYMRFYAFGLNHKNEIVNFIFKNIPS